MRTKNFSPKVQHKKFHDDLFHMGCIVTEAWPQLHHVMGASARLNGIWVGQWYLIPLSPSLHMNGRVNVTSNKTEFYAKVGSEKKLFWWVLDNYVGMSYSMPVPTEVVGEIFLNSSDILLSTDAQLAEENTAFHEFLQSCRINENARFADEAIEYIQGRGGDLRGHGSELR